MKKSKKKYDVKSVFMFETCLPEWFPVLDAHIKTFEVKKGEQIITEGEKVAGVYFVYDGVFKVHKKWGDKELIIRFANKGTIIGHRGISTKNSVYPISATALEPSVFCFMELDFFKAMLKVNVEFMYSLLMFFADELQDSERKMRNLAHMSVKGRVAQAFLNLESQFGNASGGTLNIVLSRQDLAAYVGAAYETVFRTINEMVDEGVVALEGKKIIIKNRAKLSALTEDS